MAQRKVKSDQLKRKLYKTKNSKSPDEESDLDTDLSHLVVYIKTNEFSVVNASQITIDRSDANIGKVKHRGTLFDVKILRSGSLAYVNAKADKFMNKQSMTTTDDDKQPPKKVFKRVVESDEEELPIRSSSTTDLLDLSSDDDESTTSKMDHTKFTIPIQASFHYSTQVPPDYSQEVDSNNIAKPAKFASYDNYEDTRKLSFSKTLVSQTIVSKPNAQDVYTSSVKKNILNVAQPPQLSNVAQPPQLLNVAQSSANISNSQNDHFVSYEEYEILRKQIKELQILYCKPRVSAEIFEYKGIDIVNEIHGKTAVKWSLKVVDHLFTADELRGNCLNASSRTQRGALSPNRVGLLKKAMVAKYNFEPEKADKNWLLAVRSINGKGRMLRYKFKAAFGLHN